MPPTLAEPGWNPKKFQVQKASRAVCKDCDWEYDPPEGCHQLVVYAHAAGHSYKRNHDIRFEDA